MTQQYSLDDQFLMTKYPALKRLAELRNGGEWILEWQPLRGDIGVLNGFRLWPGDWDDILTVLDVGDAKAYRFDPHGGEVWRVEGTLADVLDGLAELPHPFERNAPRLVRGRAPELWIPGNRVF